MRKNTPSPSRPALALRGAASGAPLFVGLRARYLAGERRAEEELVELAGPLGKAEVANDPSFWRRHEALLLPITVMGSSLLLVAFIPLIFMALF